MSYVNFGEHTLDECEMPLVFVDADNPLQATCQTCGKTFQGTQQPPLQPPAPEPAEQTP